MSTKLSEEKKTHTELWAEAAVALRGAARPFAFWAGTLLLMELVLHLAVFGGLSTRFLYSLCFTLSTAAVLTLVAGLFRGKRAARIVENVLLTLLFVLFAVQTVYYGIFDTLLSLSYISMGGEAVGNFLPTVFRAILRSLPWLLLLALPYGALILLRKKGWMDGEGPILPKAMVSAIAAILFFLFAMIPIWSTEDTALPGSVYRDAHTTVDRQTEFFGLLTAERLELGRMGDGNARLASGTVDLTGAYGSDGDTEESGRPAEPERNILPEMDFETLAASTDDKQLQELSEYFARLSGTDKNEYTGMFEGYNLIHICAESFSPYLVDEELTPTLYRLTHEGFIFENFYNSFPSVTTNGEYSMCMGLMPDLTHISFATSMDNYVPFCLGNEFNALGVHTRAYHNNIATFYSRINTHTNMGYDFKAVNFGLDMEKGSPASDLEMMEKTVDEYINDDQFVVHYMTYSGHMEYSFTSNDMCIKNQDRVADLDCSEEVRAFYACQLEFEDAMTYLLERLEEAGVADRTVIVISGDHYPYGLTEAGYQELAGDAVKTDPFWKYRNSFVCWNGGMEEPIVVDDYCCTQDILPTLLNLFGIAYDSRMLTGMDVLSNSTHIALIQDGSFLTKAFNYDSSSGEITWKQPQENYPAAYADDLIRTVKNEFSISAAILRTDYYRYAFSTLGLANPEGQETHYASYADTAGTWYFQAVEALTGRGALTGHHGTFGGGDPCTRSQFITMLSRTLYLDVDSTTAEAPFTDTPEGTWYYRSVAAAWAAGILPDAETFRPDDTITADASRELIRAAAVNIDIPDAEKWADQIVTGVLEEARDNGEDTSALTRGAAAALISPLIGQLD